MTIRKEIPLPPKEWTLGWFPLFFSSSHHTNDNDNNNVSLWLNLFAISSAKKWLDIEFVWQQISRTQTHSSALVLALVHTVLSNHPDTWCDLETNLEFASLVQQGLFLGKEQEKYALDVLSIMVREKKKREEKVESDAAFETFLSLYALLASGGELHLIQEPFSSHLPKLLCQTTTTMVSFEFFSLEWTCALLSRGFRDVDSRETVKFLLQQVLLSQSQFPDWFVDQELLALLQMEELYAPMMWEATGKLQVQPVGVSTGRLEAKKKHLLANHHSTFNLPHLLFSFFQCQQEVALRFLAVAKLKSLNAVCICVEALTLVLLKRSSKDDHIVVTESVLGAMMQIFSVHGAQSGFAVKRGNIVTGCLLNVLLVHGTLDQLLLFARLVPDHFLKLDSPVRMVSDSSRNFLQLLCTRSEVSSATWWVNRVLLPRDSALLYAAFRIENPSPLSGPIDFSEEDDFYSFVVYLSRFQQVDCFASVFSKEDWLPRVRKLAHSRLMSSLQCEDLTLLEECWTSEGGFTRAEHDVKLSSLPYQALSIVRCVPLEKEQRDSLLHLATEMFSSVKLNKLLRLKGLVVAAHLPIQKNDVFPLALNWLDALCGIVDPSDFVFELTEDQSKKTSTSLLWREVQACKWELLSRLAPLGFASKVQSASLLQLVEHVHVNSPQVNAHALHCLLCAMQSEVDVHNMMVALDPVLFEQAEFQKVFVYSVPLHWLKDDAILSKLLHRIPSFAKRFAKRLFDSNLVEEFLSSVVYFLHFKDSVSDVVDLCYQLASSSVHINDEEGAVHPSVHVPFLVLKWLNTLPASTATTTTTQAFLLDLAQELLPTLKTNKISSLAVFLISRAVDLPYAYCGKVLEIFSQGALVPEQRENMEMILVRMLLQQRDNSLLKELVLICLGPKMQNNGNMVLSLLSIASLAWRGLPVERERDTIMLQLAMAWITCAKSSIRILASNLCVALIKRNDISSELAHVLEPLQTNPQMIRLMERVDEDQLSCSLRYQTVDLSKLLRIRKFNLFGDLCPEELQVDRIADFVRVGQEEFFAEFDPHQRQQQQEKLEEPLVLETNALSALSRFQRKIEHGSQPSLVRNLVVIASLVDKIPNLAGLARTCEVFHARTLVMDKDPAVLKQLAEFKTISRTAEKWLPMIQVKTSELSTYLRTLQRDEGYLLLGLEQTSDSVMLQDFHFPLDGKVCLVLGAEGTGIPPDVLSLLDATVEIPQLGFVKSLNVHVSGALCVWAYTQAMMKRTTE